MCVQIYSEGDAQEREDNNTGLGQMQWYGYTYLRFWVQRASLRGLEQH